MRKPVSHIAPLLACAFSATTVAGTVLLTDDFDGYGPRSQGGPLWTVESGTWAVTEEGFRGVDCEGFFMAEGARTGRTQWGDYTLSFGFRIVSRGTDWRDGPWIGFRCLDTRNMYTLGFYTRMTALHKASGGECTDDTGELGTTNVAVTDSDWHEASISAVGRRIRIALDGAEIIDVVDNDWNDSPALTRGNIVLCARRHTGDASTEVLFRDVRVEAVGDVPETMAYTAADALRATQPSVGLLEYLANRRDRRLTRVPRKVLAFYYTWYGNPDVSGAWRHWDGVDADRHDIATSTHYPAKGAYDSQDPAIIDHHMTLAKQCGVDGFICTWWGEGSFDDKALVQVLDHAARHEFDVTLYWETIPGRGQAQIDKAVRDLEYILGTHARHPAFLKVDGKPVIFVYGRAMAQVPWKAWPTIVTETVKRTGQDFLLIADGYRAQYADVLDGVHTYNICSWVQNKTREEMRARAKQSFGGAVKLAKDRAKLSCITIIPGYDDTKIRTPGIDAVRLGGDTYRILWEEAIEADPDYVLITSWNEWHEGSEIEPSREDGDKYLKLTAEYTRRFKATPYSAVAVPSARATMPIDKAEVLRKLLAGKTVGIFPEFENPAVFRLADAGVDLKELSWLDLIDPDVLNHEHVPILLHAGGEHYVRTLKTEHDVDAALQSYLRAGGVLVTMPALPFPFYYDEKGKPVVNAAAFGLPLSGSGAVDRDDTLPGAAVKGWEKPPAGVKLAFTIDTRHLPALPAQVAFPADGDLRWRPCVALGLAEGDVYLPLARLTDANGTFLGDGIVYVERHSTDPKGGRMIYSWMRMQDILDTDDLLLGLFRLATEGIE